jgi:hypothetical protein
MKIAAEEWDLRTKQNSDDHLTQSVKDDCILPECEDKWEAEMRVFTPPTSCSRPNP